MRPISSIVMPRTSAPTAPQARPPVAPNRVVAGGGVDQLVLRNATTHNTVSFHVSPEESRRALLDSIKNAKHSFYIETFIWHDDQAGREIMNALAARKREAEARGEKFEIKVLVDWVGMRDSGSGTADASVVGKLRAIGADVKVFSPGYLDLKDRLIAPITHRKLYIQDGSQFITGGRNIGDEYLEPTYAVPGTNTREASWHDLLYTVKGDETGRVLDEFFKNWKRAGGSMPAQKPSVEPSGGSAKIETVTTNPYTGTHGIRKAHEAAIADAKSEIVAIYPYFSDDELIEELIAAKKKNPKLSVKVMLPANKEASHEGSMYATLNKETARQLLQAGVEVRMFSGGQENGQDVQRFSHMKAMVVDGKLLSIGSANADARTYNNNCELNTLISDPSTVQDLLSKVVRPDWASARPATLKELNSVSLWERIKEKTLDLFDWAM